MDKAKYRDNWGECLAKGDLVRLNTENKHFGKRRGIVIKLLVPNDSSAGTYVSVRWAHSCGLRVEKAFHLLKVA